MVVIGVAKDDVCVDLRACFGVDDSECVDDFGGADIAEVDEQVGLFVEEDLYGSACEVGFAVGV